MSTKTQTSARLEDELSQLSKEKADSLQRAKRLSQVHDRAWKDEITTLAQIMEKGYLLLEQKWLITTISEEIGRLYRENDISIWPIVDRYLPTKYKSHGQQYDSSTTSGTEVSDLREDFINVTTGLQRLAENIADIGRQELAEEIEAAESFAKRARKRAALEHIALRPNENSSFTDQINDSREDDREHITIDRPAPHGSLMYDSIATKITRWQKVQQRVFEFPPEILSKDKEYAEALEAADVWMDPVLDLKYSKSLQDWLKAESYRDVYGKHAAGVMSYSVTNLCLECSDEKTKQWVRMEPRYATTFSIYECLQCNAKKETMCYLCNLPMREQSKPEVGWVCPECEGTQSVHRNLTREQIGDKSSIIVDIAERLIEKIPDCAAFCSWYRDWLERRVGGRKSRASQELSDKA